MERMAVFQDGIPSSRCSTTGAALAFASSAFSCSFSFLCLSFTFLWRSFSASSSLSLLVRTPIFSAPRFVLFSTAVASRTADAAADDVNPRLIPAD